MNKTDLEHALDRLENALCAAKISPSLKREIDIFCTHLASELLEAWEKNGPPRSELFASLSVPGAN